MTRAPEKRLATVNGLIGLFNTKLAAHQAEKRCTHGGEVAQLRQGLAKQESIAEQLREEIAAYAAIAEAVAPPSEPWPAEVDGMTQECREGQHHACVGDPWRATADDPVGCSCSHHIEARIPEEGP